MKKEQFDTPFTSDYWMESNGFYCGFNMPEALDLEDGEMQGLPPYNWRSSFLVDEYPACPKDWLRSEGRMTSHFVPIQDGKGMWLDFNKNKDQKYELAIVVSVQGVNAITGMPCKDVQLEQYIDSCPVHNKPFGANRLCEECGYKWPKQNYISTTGTPSGQLWIDGFRAANGAVQQYILTEKTMNGVASNILGSERVYAIGVSFFLSKTAKPEPVYGGCTFRSIDVCSPYTVNWNSINYIDNTTSDGYSNNVYDTHIKCSNITTTNGEGVTIDCLSEVTPPVFSKGEARVASYTNIVTKNMEIGQGASIKQQVYDDPETLDFWRDEPESILCLNYCLEKEAIQIINQGKVKKDGHAKGFLKDIPVAV